MKKVLFLRCFAPFFLITMGLFASCQREIPGAIRWHESINQLNEGAQSASLRACRFESSAQRAEREALPGAARLFYALASAERVQEQHCIETITRLGGGYTPPYRPRVFVRNTQENLWSALHDSLPYGLIEIEQVNAEGNRYAARLMIRHIASCNRCRRAVEHYLGRGEEQAPHFGICPRCGYLTDDRYPDPYCPQCGESGRKFQRF